MSASDFQIVAQNTTATIAINTALSGAVDLYGCSLCGLQMPAAWTAASLSFDVSADGATYGPLYVISSALAVTEYALTSPAASQAISLDPAIFAGWRYVKVRSGTSGATVNQGAARVITLAVRPV